MATDQEIRDAGFKYIPQQKYLQNPFEIPVAPEAPVVNQGIVNTNAFAGSGGDGFNPYNTNMSNVRQDYNAFPSRQAGEIYSKIFNPQPYGTGVESAQAAYNQANQALAQGMDPNSQGYGSFTGGTLTGLKDIANEIIMNNKEQYGAQGQYVDPYDPRYSSVTEAQKFMDNFPEYYNEPPPSKMEGLLSMLPYVGSLTRGAKFLGDQISPYLPVNRRSILENELGGKGIMINDIGQIVQGEGAYDTAGNIMSGYNASRMTADTFDKRIASLGNMTPEGRAKRTAAIEAAKADFLNAQKTTDEIYDFEEDEKEKKKKDTIVGRFITKRNEKKAIKAAKDAKDAEIAAAAAASGGSGRSYDAPGGVRSSDYNQAANVASGGGGDRARNAQGQTAREATYDGNKNTGTAQGYSQHYARGGRAGYFYGGRVNFKNGGLASIL